MDISSTSKALELGRQKIDEEIHKLKTCRNTLAYISRLPTEIISRIFCILASSSLDRSDDLSWIPAVTAICGHWRAIALECPNLWSCIVCSRPKWVEEMLKRSKMAPLIIRADNPYTAPPNNQVDAIRLSLQHISRIKELHLAAPKATIANLIDPIDKPAPLLRSLHLFSQYYHEDDTYTLPETLFVYGGRRLHRLELFDCRIPWESPLLCGLVHFKFVKQFRETLPAAQLLDVLEKMPLLETLDLEGLLPVPSGDSNRVVHLPRLTSLRVSYTVPGGANPFKLISFPASTSLGLYCEITSGNDYSTVCDAVSSVWNGKEGSQLLRYLVIDGSRRLQGWTTIGRYGEEPSGPSQIEVGLSWPGLEDTDYNAMIINFCNALTLTNLHTLFVSNANITTATWLTVFGHLTSLQTLHICAFRAFELVSALSKTLKDTEEIFLSGLHDLWLEGTNFRHTFHDKTLFEELRDCLMTRCHWSAELHGLHLHDCYNVFFESVELLREIVVDVDWDISVLH